MNLCAMARTLVQSEVDDIVERLFGLENQELNVTPANQTTNKGESLVEMESLDSGSNGRVRAPQPEIAQKHCVSESQCGRVSQGSCTSVCLELSFFIQ